MKEVTVVIPNYKGEAYLRPCVESLLAGTGLEMDVIIVDNGSRDGCVEEVRRLYPQVECVCMDQNYGFCKAVNIGIRKAETPYVFLLNNDTLVCKGAVEAMLASVKKDRRIFSVEAKMIQYQDRTKIDSAGTFYNAFGWAYARGKDRPADQYRKRGPVFSACAGAAMYRREVFEEIGLFDEEHFAYLEDVDVGYRARIAGYRNVYEPMARIIHVGSAASGSRHNEFKVRLSARNNLYLIYKNMPVLQILLNLPFLLAGFLIKYLFFLKKGLGAIYLKGLMEAPKLMKKKKKVLYQKGHLKNYLKIQMELWINIFRFFS
ncbi:glycosyltransferase family 2 protein [Mordavella massiliensis]|uniref:Glycosyltransferase family 2 protein n=1 Tax=Mordavella massiliensis TaxID=1871024 RepID=A0A938WYP5_9CLOT|nr:glycosyltransferase family 2 protein [Mordavella massiliensis]MBM6826111.1 glycosyltransferase family 2 protein [Mordavella massiliensis]